MIGYRITIHSPDNPDQYECDWHQKKVDAVGVYADAVDAGLQVTLDKMIMSNDKSSRIAQLNLASQHPAKWPGELIKSNL